MKNKYQIRNVRRDEMADIMAMAAREGWNPGLQDHLSFYEADPEGFFVGEIEEQAIAYISAVNYNDVYGFVGLYMVAPTHRGQGYGYALWNHATKRIAHLPIGLDGVPEQIENYKSSGFVYAFRQVRLSCRAISLPEIYPESQVHELTGAPPEDLLAYDRLVFGTPREDFIRAWCSMADAHVFYTTDETGIITGYAVIRKCQDGYKIGPLFAGNENLAEYLFLACHRAVQQGENVYIDMPETNPVTHKWTDRYGLVLSFETARMYTSGGPGFSTDQLYAVTSFELG